MLKHAASLAVAALFLAPAGASAADKGPKPGKWETTVTTKIQGMAMQPQPHTASRCITPKDAEDRQKWLPPTDDPHQKGCKISAFKHDGNKLSWEVKCDNASGEGTMTLGAESYEGKMKMTMQRPGSGDKMEMNIDIKGKRLGDC